MNLESRSCLQGILQVISCLQYRITSMEKWCMTSTTRERCLSKPTLSILLIFHVSKIGSVALRALSSVATSKFYQNFDTGRPTSRKVGVNTECNFSYIIKCKTLQNILQIQEATLLARLLQNFQESNRDNLHDSQKKIVDRMGVELVAGDFPLQLLDVSIRIEDPRAQKIVQNYSERLSLGIILLKL